MGWFTRKKLFPKQAFSVELHAGVGIVLIIEFNAWLEGPNDIQKVWGPRLVEAVTIIEHCRPQAVLIDMEDFCPPYVTARSHLIISNGRLGLYKYFSETSGRLFGLGGERAYRILARGRAARRLAMGLEDIGLLESIGGTICVDVGEALSSMEEIANSKDAE